MNKIFRISTLLALCAAALFSSCAKDEFDTDQYSDKEVTFSALAPNPVARGAELRIYGSNLQNVKEVCIPGIEPITDIKVEKTGRMSEIRVIVPVDGPEVGKVQIVTNDGKTLSSWADLTYSEPIIFTEMTCASTVLSGDIITFTGDYMNNIKEVVFEGGATATTFVSQDRYELKVAVPANALSGKVAIGDVNELDNPDGLVANLYYSENAITVGDPTVTAAGRGALNALDTIKVTGTHLDMIASANFGGVDAYLEIAEDGKSLRTAVPMTAADGEVNLVTYAGKTISAGAYTTIVPGNLAVAAKTRYKAYKEAVITGNGLKLVTGITLGGAECSYVYSSKDNNITVTISEKATNGPFVLALANGKTVETAEIELVAPVVEEITPTELYAGDEDIIVKGTDLDLVTGVTLGGKDAEFKATGETKLAVKCATTAVSGKIVLTLANGVKIEPETDITVNYHSLVIVTERTSAQHIGEEVVIKGVNMDLVENIFIGETKVTKYSLRTADEVRFLVPWAKVGMYDLSFHLFSGDVETQPEQFEVQLEREFKVIWEGSQPISWSGSAMQALGYGGYDWASVKPGSTILVEYENNGGQMRLAQGEGWTSLPSFAELPGYDSQWSNLPLAEGSTYVSLVLKKADIEALLLKNGGLIVCGEGYTCTKVTLITEISQEKTIWSGSQKVAWDDKAAYLDTPGNKALQALAWGGYDWASVEAGTTINVYYNIIPDDGYSQIRFGNGSWSPLPGTPDSYDITNGDGKYSLVLDQAMIDEMVKNGGLVICGNGFEVTEVTLKD